MGEKSDFYLNSYSWIPANCHLIKLEVFKKYRPMMQNKYNIYQMQPALCIQEHKKANFEKTNVLHLGSQIQMSSQKNQIPLKLLNKKLYQDNKSLVSKVKKEIHKFFYRKKIQLVGSENQLIEIFSFVNIQFLNKMEHT